MSSIIKTIITVLKIRKNQFLRVLKEIGIFRSIILFILLAIIILVLIKKVAEGSYTNIILSVSILMLLDIQVRRKDLKFLQKMFPSYKFILFAEYFVIGIPITITFFFHNWLYAVILLISIFLIVQLKITLTFQRNRITSLHFLNGKYFEWISGFRTNFPAIVILYLLCFSLSEYELVLLFGLVILSLIYSGNYIYAEPLDFILVYKMPAKKFLLRKILQSMQLFVFFALPIIMLYIFRHYDLWYILPIALFVSSSILTYAVLLKYGVYEPNQNLQGNLILLVIFTILFIQPYLAPLTIMLIIRNYYKAIKNLNNYLNVFDK